MMNKLYLFLLFFASNLSAQVMLKPTELMDFLEEKSSKAIVISDDTNLLIKSQKKIEYERHYEVVVKKGGGDRYKNIVLYEDKFRKVTFARVKIKSIDGEVLRTLYLESFNEVAAGLSNLASDSRAHVLEIGYKQYPFILEVEEKISYKGSLHFPKWIPQYPEVRLLNATLSIEDQTNSNLRYKEYNKAQMVTANFANTMTWEVEHLSPYKFEAFNSNIYDYTPVVRLAPNKFEMDGNPVDMSTWSSLGSWFNRLNEDRGTIPKESLIEVDKLLVGIDAPIEKTKVIYDYLQNNTRYVSIQLGIGGWQPFESSFTHENKYGDCKALSFYTKSLLSNYGIDSWYTIINAGKYVDRTADENYPNAEFNHAILTVPFEKDTLFLECTSQTNPFGYQGSFTGNRKALVLKPDGGALIQTTRYDEATNVVDGTINIDLGGDGGAKVDIRKEMKGITIEHNQFSRIYTGNEQDQYEWLLENYELPQVVRP